MKRLNRYRPSPALAVATLALFVALGGGAYALSIPKDSVGSYQIRAGGVGFGEIAKGAVTSTRVRDKAIGKGAINDNAVRSNHVLDNSLTGNDIDESTLALQNRGVTVNSTCDPTSTAVVDCGTISLTGLTQPAKVLLTADWDWHQTGAAAENRGQCELFVDNVALPGAVSESGTATAVTDATHPLGGALSAVTPTALAAGDHQLSLRCSEEQGSVVYKRTTLTAVTIGAM
jgi:hypothetical protein